MEEEKRKKKSLMPVLVVAVILLIISGGVFLVRSQTFLQGSASRATVYSPTNSYIFGSPLTARADDKEKIKISVFLLNGQGLGVEGKMVQLSASPGINVESSQPQTDDTGQAVFYLTSPSIGRYQVNAQADGQTLPQTVTVNFK
ncbi:MAG: Ig-like domain-containing protein [Candidatus Shapirobacteria bacterium]|nr:Ig-like domain-containing protein [Candidatus Shapirobacteria bacterium]